MYKIIILEQDETVESISTERFANAEMVVRNNGRGVWNIVKSRLSGTGFVDDDYLISEIRSALSHRNNSRLNDYAGDLNEE